MLKIFTPIFILLITTLSLLLLEERKQFDIRTLVHIDPIPHTQVLINQEKFAEAEAYLSYFITYDYVNKNPKSHQLLNFIHKKREDYGYKTEKFFEGLSKGKSDEDIGKLSAFASDFLLIGDIRDLSIEGKHYIQNEKVDNTMVALSSLGLIASASTFYSLGATTPLKTSLSILKYANRIKKLPPWLKQQLLRQAEVSNRTKSLSNLKMLLQPIYTLYTKIGLNQTLEILKKSTNLQELQQLTKLTSRFAKKSNLLLKITKGKALNTLKNMPNVKNSTILYASTYGEKGLQALKVMGESKFVKRVGLSANLSKTTYKGNLNSLFNYLLRNVPTSLLYFISFLGLFYFIQKLYTLFKKISLIPHLAK